MEILKELLSANYFWLMLIALFLIFALIGYLVDQKEAKNGLSQINRPKEKEVDISELASMAQNKSMNEAVTAAARKNSTFPQPNLEQNINNTITDTTNPTTNTNTVGFDVLSK